MSRPQILTSIALFVTLWVVAPAAAQVRTSTDLPVVGNRVGFAVQEAAVYRPANQPNGIRVQLLFDTADLPINESKSFEVDVVLDRRVGKLFEIADAVLWTDKEGGSAPSEIQPFHNQSPPKEVDARLLFPPLKRGKYPLSLYLAPRDGKTDPSRGLEFLSGAELNRNVQAMVVGQ